MIFRETHVARLFDIHSPFGSVSLLYYNRVMGFVRFSCIGALIALIHLWAAPASDAQQFLSCQNDSASPATLTGSLPIVSPSRALEVISSSSIKEEFDRLSATFATRGMRQARSVHISDSAVPNAFINREKKLFITSALVDLVGDLDQLRYVLAHEMAHIALGHGTQHGQSAEADADVLALSILEQRGVNPCSAPRTLQTLRSRHPLYERQLRSRLRALDQALDGRCDEITSRDSQSSLY